MPFPPGSGPPPSPSYGGVISRTLGSLQLNDRIQTFYDKDVIAGVAKNTFEQRVRFSGEQVPVLQDKKGLEIIVYGKWRDMPGMLQWEDFQDLIDASQGASFNNGFRIYNPVYPQDVLGTLMHVANKATNKPYRWIQWSFKLFSRYTTFS